MKAIKYGLLITGLFFLSACISPPEGITPVKNFDIQKYKPHVISVEYLDLKMKKLEFKNNDINNLINSNLYKFFTKNNYYFVNWLHGDLIFIHKNFRY